ncbi:hypothetical protein Tsp_08453 [Trichinella spiralis]|uniref:hypothetical protein n=1 Tax=Trichinella spiralis TaxID=6334 RepID=UPI0001EFB782|nr:hypothetical protein Tsp_08453 [Trichinella spiralis]
MNVNLFIYECRFENSWKSHHKPVAVHEQTFIPVFRKTTKANANEIKEIFGLSDSLLKLQDRSEKITKQQQPCPNRSMFTICRDISLKRETKMEKRNQIFHRISQTVIDCALFNSIKIYPAPHCFKLLCNE